MNSKEQELEGEVIELKAKLKELEAELKELEAEFKRRTAVVDEWTAKVVEWTGRVVEAHQKGDKEEEAFAKEQKADAEKQQEKAERQQEITLSRLKDVEAQIAALRSNNVAKLHVLSKASIYHEGVPSFVASELQIIPVEEAVQQVLAKITWQQNLTDFEPKPWVSPVTTTPLIAESVGGAQVFGKFLHPEAPDFLLTEMQRGWSSSSQLLQYSYNNGVFEYQSEIPHESLKDYDTVVLIGTSGAGKTSISLRLAGKDYVLLFVSDPKGNGGSLDVKHLVKKAEALYGSSEDAQQVDDYVQDQFRKLLLFRKRVLEACRLRYVGFSPLHWAMAQLYPEKLLGVDVFWDFIETPTERMATLPALNEFTWIVLDESQSLDSKLPGVFPSRNAQGPARSLLAPFVRTLEDVKAKKLICGTGLSASSVTDAVVSPIKASARTVVVGVATYLDDDAVEQALIGWGVPVRQLKVDKKAYALFAGRPRQAAYFAEELIETNGEIRGLAEVKLRNLFDSALKKTKGLDPVDPKKNSFREAGDDLLLVLQESALHYVLGRSGIVRTGGFFAVQHGICTLAPRALERKDSQPSKKQRVEGECVIAEALVVKAFADPLANIFELRILKSTNHSDVGFTVEDYLALRHNVLTSAVRRAAIFGKEKLNLHCQAYDRDWKYLHEEYYVQIVARCSREGEETTTLRRWLHEKRSGVIMPVTAHGADLILLNWDDDKPLVIIVQSKSGVSVSTPKALLSLLLPYTTNREQGKKVESSLGRDWEQLLVDKRCLVAYVVFKPLEGSQKKAVSLAKGNDRLILVLDKNSWTEFASELSPGVENLTKFKAEV